MFGLEINGTKYTAYESWKEVPLAEFVKLTDHAEAYYTLTGLDVPTLVEVLPEQQADRLLNAYNAMQAMRLRAWPPLADIGRRKLADYIKAKEHVRAHRHYEAVKVYYPDVQDNAQDCGMAWLEFAKGWTAYNDRWAWVDELRFMGPSPNMSSMQKYGALALVFDLAPSADKLDAVLNLEADEAMMYRAYKTEHATITHNFQYMRAQKQ